MFEDPRSNFSFSVQQSKSPDDLMLPAATKLNPLLKDAKTK